MDSFLIWSVILNFFVRWLISRFSYSGAHNAPIYGDYEAQRHWMEITYGLKITDWYKNTTDNDLQYWGLDYPPLTAYHSWLNGYLSNKFNHSWIELHKSRGHQSYHHKIFMRSTVLASDLLIYFPAMIYFAINLKKSLSPREKTMTATIGLLYPALILIDHGHFQYNNVSLGLTLWAINFILQQRLVLSSMLFCLALNYKQISLYFSIPFFFFILGSCTKNPSKIKGFFTLILVSITVLATFFVTWFPFLENRQSVLTVVNRLFPFNRGLYEDKVANVWCSLEVLIKLKKLFTPQQLATFAAGTITALHLPIGYHLFRNPTPKKFLYSLAYSSLVFFLFAFQVHEKSILFAAMPIILLMHDDPLATLWFYIMSTFSLLPLMAKDGLVMPTIALMLFSIIVFVAFFHDMGLNKSFQAPLRAVSFTVSIMGCILLAIASIAVKPPPRYPDLWILLNAIYSCAHFLAFAFYYYDNLFREAPYYTPLKSKSS